MLLTCDLKSKKQNSMEDLEGPDKGGPGDRDTMEKLPDWTQVIYGAGKRQNHAKAPAEGGKGWGKGSKLRQVITVMPQGERREFPDPTFNINALYEKPVVLMAAQKVPAPAYEMTNMGMLSEVRMSSHASFILLQKILRDYHGDLDSATTPCHGQLISLKLRFENYGALFDDPGWPKVLHELLRKDFVGFPAGAMADVIPMHGKPPIVTMTCLAFKSEATNSLYSNPVVNKSFTMNSSRRTTCAVSLQPKDICHALHKELL